MEKINSNLSTVEARLESLEKLIFKVRRAFDENPTFMRAPYPPGPSTPKKVKPLILVPPPLPPDPPQESIPRQLTSVLSVLKSLLIPEPGERKTLLQRVIIEAEDLIEVFVHRDKKAEEKYGRGLALEDEKNGLEEGINKISDGVFLLTHSIQKRNKKFPLTQEERRKVRVIKNLQEIIQNLLLELK